jgi:hypothetical protein
MNSPLQTVEMNAALLRRRHPEEAIVLDRIDRALGRLSTVNRIAESEEHRLDLGPSGLKFDSSKVIRYGN